MQVRVELADWLKQSMLWGADDNPFTMVNGDSVLRFDGVRCEIQTGTMFLMWRGKEAIAFRPNSAVAPTDFVTIGGIEGTTKVRLTSN